MLTSRVSVLDSCVFIGYLRNGWYATRVEGLEGLIRTSSVVLAELWRGATRREEHTFLSHLENVYPVWTPNTKNWLDSGRILSRMRIAESFGSEKLRALHFDILIALTARSYGARVVTANRVDFELIRKYQPFELEILPEGQEGA
jgi:predicted nucleic acid-binding protein